MRKHNHYFKDVTHLTEVDVYRVCKLFGINDPSGALQHAIKKLLVAGGRGAGKDETRDIKEAIDTLQRYLELKREDDSPLPIKVINNAGSNVSVEVQKTSIGVEIRLLDSSTTALIKRLKAELDLCCGTLASKANIIKLAEDLEIAVRNERGYITVAGLPCIVANEKDACDTMDDVMRYKVENRANAVMITERLYNELKRMTNSVAVKCPKCETGGGPCYCGKR